MSTEVPLPDGLARHFTIHDAECDVPRLLESVRAHIVELGSIDVMDMSFSAHFDGPDFVAEMTVYYRPHAPAE